MNKNFLCRIGDELSYGGLILSNGNEVYIVPLPEEFENIQDIYNYSLLNPDLCKSPQPKIGPEFKVIDTRNGIFDKIICQRYSRDRRDR